MAISAVVIAGFFGVISCRPCRPRVISISYTLWCKYVHMARRDMQLGDVGAPLAKCKF